jgi:hypothetical protein
MKEATESAPSLLALIQARVFDVASQLNHSQFAMSLSVVRTD